MSNKKFMCILRSESGACEKPSPSDMETMYAKYQAWQSKFAKNILDMGGALSGAAAVVTNDSVKDGPFIELKEVVGGYMLLSGESLDEVVKVIQQSPMVENPRTSLEIREISTP
ncbi:MAG: YciI family protein [Paraglaciecola sp.]|uniref:YciI family protein n=1 Tax=Paraglaciecola sp. TaxID=1920173 RepID=UPI003297D7C1